ncbi:MAG: hypothetical protein KKE62_17595 [Proteobacteria bacterium]|nr:hypothetical protein [Pseudomonadota bacterium]MBU1386538.1 hypothetical protein [Pseudomonadota bacterium]MBU1544649.1 hypothetical protein [Pseudomonadota bacterium]MBU2481372.1 hypothetical protein [Pseudomonadota bacterium]
MDQFKQEISRYVSKCEDYFIHTDALAVIVLDKNMNIITHNHCFGRLVGSGKSIAGESMYSFMLPESHESLTALNSAKDQSVCLNFKTRDASIISLQCHVVHVDAQRHLIFGVHLMLTNEQALQKMTIMSNEMANLARDLYKKNRELKDAHAKIKTLSGIVPICMHCKEIRDDKGYWNQLEKYISEHSEVTFSHGLCDKCLEKYYPGPGDIRNEDPGEDHNS